MDVKPINVLGFYTVDHVEKETNLRIGNGDEIIITAVNMSKVFGYLPIIGTIVGFAFLVFAKMHDDRLREDFGNSFVNCLNGRSIVTAFSLGALFLIPDIVATVAYHFFKFDEPILY